VKIGAVTYLNSKPLVHRLDTFAPQADVVFDLPSRLADRLADGDLDVALIPSIEVLSNPQYRIVSNACIGCRRAVWSVKLLSRVPMSQIRTLALDEGSRTSVALVQILLGQRHGVRPEMSPLPIGADPVASSADAVLLIGDRAIHAPDDSFVEAWDLGQQWCDWAGLPFVFAVWAARIDRDVEEIEAALVAARDAGVAQLEQIARDSATPLGLSVARCLEYLRDNLHFHLGPQEQRGLARFHQHAAQLGLLPLPAEIEST